MFYFSRNRIRGALAGALSTLPKAGSAMSLILSGQCVAVRREMVTPANSAPFESVTLNVFTGQRVEYVRLSKDFPAESIPAEGTDVALDVFVTTYPRKDGKAAYRLMTSGLAAAGKRAA